MSVLRMHSVWLSDGDHRSGGENEAVEGARDGPSHQRPHPVDVVVGPPVRTGGDRGWSQAPGWVERAASQRVAVCMCGKRVCVYSQWRCGAVYIQACLAPRLVVASIPRSSPPSMCAYRRAQNNCAGGDSESAPAQLFYILLCTHAQGRPGF